MATPVKLPDKLKNGIMESLLGSDDFWSALEKRGTPLVEPIEGDPLRVKATFIWKGKSDTKSVGLFVFSYGRTRLRDFAFEKIQNTEIWFHQQIIRRDARFLYTMVENFLETPSESPTFEGRRHFDPYNSKFRTELPNQKNPSPFQKNSIAEMPDAPKQPLLELRKDTPKGDLEDFTFKSKILNNERLISLYKPKQKCEDGKCGVLIIFDRNAYLDFVPLPTVMDNLIHEKKIPPIYVALVGVPESPNDVRFKELSCNEKFSDFVATELFSYLKEKLSISMTPEKNVIAGSSLGGLAATCIAIKYSKFFRNVLSQSGAFWWTPDYDALKVQPALASFGEPNKVANQFIELPKLPLRFYLEAGNFELDMSSRGGSVLVPNRHLRDVLRAKNYEVKWSEFAGGHDYLTWRSSIADGLIYLLRE